MGFTNLIISSGSRGGGRAGFAPPLGQAGYHDRQVGTNFCSKAHKKIPLASLADLIKLDVFRLKECGVDVIL